VKATRERERDHKQMHMSQLAREKETVQERLVQITRERDTALRVSENRCRAWEMHRIQSAERENYLQDQIEAVLWRYTISTTCDTLFLALYQFTQRWDLR